MFYCFVFKFQLQFVKGLGQYCSKPILHSFNLFKLSTMLHKCIFSNYCCCCQIIQNVLGIRVYIYYAKLIFCDYHNLIFKNVPLQIWLHLNIYSLKSLIKKQNPLWTAVHLFPFLACKSWL